MKRMLRSWGAYRALTAGMLGLGLVSVICFALGRNGLALVLLVASLVCVGLQNHVILTRLLRGIGNLSQANRNFSQEIHRAVTRSADEARQEYARVTRQVLSASAAAGSTSGVVRQDVEDLRRELLATESELLARLGETTFSAAATVQQEVHEANQSVREELGLLISELRGSLRDERRRQNDILEEAQRSREVIQSLLAGIDEKVAFLNSELIETRRHQIEGKDNRQLLELRSALSAVGDDVRSLGAVIAELSRDEPDHQDGSAVMALGVNDEIEKVSSIVSQIAERYSDIPTIVKHVSASEASLARLAAEVESIGKHARAQFAYIQSKFLAVRASMEQLPQDASEYLLLRQQLVNDDLETPPVGGWALSGPTLTAIARRILNARGDISILELGSGASTVWIAMALRAHGRGHCFTLEHLSDYANRTRDELERRGLAEWVTVIDSPLRDIEVEGQVYKWYDTGGLPADLRVDILLVDGPPGDTGELARFPAYPILSPRLNDGAWVVLDDTIREDEKRVVEKWSDRRVEAGVLEGARSTGKSTIMVFQREA